MSIPTDSKGIDEAKDPETDNVFALHKFFTDGPEFEEVRDRYESGGIGYKESKDILIKNIIRFVAPLRDKRAELEKDRDYVIDVIKKGGKKVRERAEEKMIEVRNKIGVTLT